MPVEVQCQDAAEGEPNEMASRQSEQPNEFRKAAGVVGEPERFGWIRGFAGARGVPRHDGEVVRQIRELPMPGGPTVADETVQQDDGLAFPARR